MAKKPTTPLPAEQRLTPHLGALLNLGFRSVNDDGQPVASEDPAALQQNLPQYRVRELIGRGGMGNVIIVDDPKLERAVALKVMNLGPEATDDERGRFVREATALARLAHPNIVPIYDLGTDEAGCPFYTTKLVKGRTLQAILRDVHDGAPDAAREHSLDRLLSVFRKMCDAVAIAHSRGIIHRDLKPDNVMVGEFGEVLVMDWGLAKILGQAEEGPADAPSSTIRQPSSFGATLEGSIVGTPQYMSPEQAEGRVGEMDARSDVFSLGGILYAILTLHPPVDGKTLDEVLLKVTGSNITRPSTYGTHAGKVTPRAKGEVLEARRTKPLAHCPGGRVPAALSAVAMKALNVDKTARYQTVSSLSADVESFQGGFATNAEEAGAWRQIALFIRRHKGVASAIAAGFLIVAALSASFIIKVARERNCAKRALSDLKKTAPTLLGLARNEADLQRLESVLGKLDATLALDPTLLDAWWERGWALMALEKWNEAADALRLAAETDKTRTASCTDALPLLGELAAAPDDAARFGGAHATALGEYFQRVGANATLLALSKRIGLSNQARLALVRQRINARLGKKAPDMQVSLDDLGRVAVRIGNSLADSVEPLRGLPIDVLNLNLGYKINNIEPLRGIRLQELDLTSSRVSDLTPLSGMKLRSLKLNTNSVVDLSPLRGMPLSLLDIGNCKVTSVEPLRGMPLREIRIMNGGSISSPESIPKILQGMPLENVTLQGCGLVDLDFLAGAPIRMLSLQGNPLRDISALRGTRIRELLLQMVKVTDLSPLEGMPLRYFNFFGCDPHADLKPLLKVPALTTLQITENESLEVLRHHPGLVSIMSHPASKFWKVYDEKGVKFILSNPRHPIWDAEQGNMVAPPSQTLQPPILPNKASPAILPQSSTTPPADGLQIEANAATKRVRALTTSYEATTLADIVNSTAQLSGEKIDGSEGIELVAESWAIYNTSEGNFGKFKIAELQGTSLVLDWITYNHDGSTRPSGKRLIVRITWPFDLDSGTVPGSQGQADFHWQGVTKTVRFLVPTNHSHCVLISRGKN